MTLSKINSQQAQKTLELFTSTMQKEIKRGKLKDPKEFSTELYQLKPIFDEPKNSAILLKKVKQFAEQLVSSGHDKFAGVIYSFILKTVKEPKLIEDIAVRQLALAKRTKDPIHIMARVSDIRKVYESLKPRSPEHLKWLREERKSLRTIINHYEHSRKNFQTVSRKARPIENYEECIACVQVEIAKILKKQSPKEALQSLQEAESLFEKLKLQDQLKFCKSLIKETKSILDKQL